MKNVDNNQNAAGSYEQLKDVVYQLKLDEGFREKPYLDTMGHLTIGYGINLENGITEREASMILEERVRKIRTRLPFTIKFFKNLSPTRQDVLINMAYNLGISGLLKFKKMLQALEEKHYEKAAKEMLDSLWAIQVGKRADQLAYQMRHG